MHMGSISTLMIMLAGHCVWAAEPSVSELRGSRWVEVPAPVTKPTTDAELARIEGLVSRNQNPVARKALVQWFKQNPSSPMRDRAIFMMATALYQYGDRIRAFYYLDELMDEYPESPLFPQALEKQYQIADAYLDGYKRRLFKLPLIEADDEALDMLFRIQQRSPGSPLAEKALLRSADHYYFSGQYDLSADAYNFYAKQYPRSPTLPQVKLRQAFSNYAQFRGLRFDAAPLVEARAQLMDLVTNYPELAAEERIPTFVQRIDKTFAAKMYVQADFYRRTHEPRAAVYMYETLIKAYPDSTEAAQAKGWLTKMPQWARS